MKPLAEKKYKKRGVCVTKFCNKRLPKSKYMGLCSTCRARKSRLADPVRYAYNNLKNRAKQRGLAFTITIDDFKKFCIKTRYIAGKGTSADSFTVDRIYNNVGYHVDNIRVLSKADNIRKFHLSYDWEHKIATVY